MLEDAEVEQNDDGDERPEQKDEFALGDEIRLAGFVDEFGDFAHGAMHGQVLEAHVDDHAETEPEEAEQNADHEQVVAVDGAVEEADGGKVGKFERGFAARFRLSKSGCSADGKQRG